MTRTLKTRIDRLNGNKVGAIYKVTPGGRAPDEFTPGVDGLDLNAHPTGPVFWRDRELDDFEIIGGPNAMSHEDALAHLD